MYILLEQGSCAVDISGILNPWYILLVYLNTVYYYIYVYI